MHEIAVPSHYDLLKSVHAWIFSDIQPVPEQTDEISIFRLFTIDNGIVPVRLIQHAPGEAIRISLPPSYSPGRAVSNRIKEILCLQIDTASPLAILESEGLIAEASSLMGIRPYLSDTCYEALVKCILQQQVSYRAANLFTKRFVIQLGPRFQWSDLEFFGFPEHEVVLNGGLDLLKKIGLGYKAEYVYEICSMITEGNLSIDGLAGKPYSEVEKILLPIRGIGPWTVKALAISGLGDFHIFPYSDLGIRNLLGRMYQEGERFTVDQVKALRDSWGSAGDMALYLLMCADVLGLLGSNSR